MEVDEIISDTDEDRSTIKVKYNNRMKKGDEDIGKRRKTENIMHSDAEMKDLTREDYVVEQNKGLIKMKANDKNINIKASLNKKEKEVTKESMKSDLSHEYHNDIWTQNQNNESEIMNSNVTLDMEKE